MKHLLLIFFLLTFSTVSQWARWLPVYLSSVTTTECVSVCNSTAFTPVCEECSDDDYSVCVECHSCRVEYNSSYYNLLDGICMTTEDYGVATGLGFSLTFSTVGLLAGYFVDKNVQSVRSVLGISTIFGGILILLSGMCTSYWQMLILRALLGACQAFAAPTTSRLVVHYFPNDRDRPIPNGCYVIGIYLGLGCSTLSSIAASDYGWRFTFYFLGMLMLVLSFSFELIFDVFEFSASPYHIEIVDSKAGEDDPLIKKDKNRYFQSESIAVHATTTTNTNNNNNNNNNNSNTESSDSNNSNNISNITTHSYHSFAPYSLVSPDRSSNIEPLESLSSIPAIPEEQKRRYIAVCGYIVRREWYLMLFLLLASALRFITGLIVLIYSPILLARRFPSYETYFSIANAIIFLTCGTGSSFLGGLLGQSCIKQEGYAGLARMVAFGCLLCIAPYLLAFTLHDFWTAMILLAVGYLIGESWLGASFTLIQGLAPPEYQGIAMSVFLFLNWLSSALVIDVLGVLDPGTVGISVIMCSVVFFSLLISGFLFFFLGALIDRPPAPIFEDI